MIPSGHLARAAQHHASGDLFSARREAEAALAAEPHDVNALRFVGVINCQSGDARRGAEYLTRALAQDPSDEPTRINLLQALLDSGQLAAAEAVASSAPRSNNPQLLRVRAAVARLAGRADEAIDLLERATAHAPKDFACWNNLGNVLHEADQAERAVDAFDRAVALNPGVAVVHLNRGRALASAGRHEDALRAFQTAARLDPKDGPAFFEVGKCLLRLGRPEEALPVLGTAARMCRTDANIFNVIGLAFGRLHDLKQAEDAYRAALHVDPANAPAYLNLAMLLERGNRLEELESLQQQHVLDHGLETGEAHYIQALVSRRKGRFEEALALAQRAQPKSLDPALREQFIGEVADRLGDTDAAFAAYSEMNRVMASNPDAAHIDRTLYRQRIEGWTDEIRSDPIESWRPVEPAREPRSPAFLVGFLRSGTTLLDTILMGHPGADVFEEEPMLARVEDALGERRRLGELDTAAVEELRATYFKSLSRPPSSGKLLIDKNPLATLRAGIIHRLFPDAPFIFAVRHPCDVVLSCFMQNFLVTESMASFLDLENAALVYDRAMTHWQTCREILPLRVHMIRYEDMVEDVEREMRPLLDFLDLPWDASVLDHQKTASERGYIRTPSYAQVTEGIYARASGRWERYREHMEPVLPILAPWVERFGYPPIDGV